MKPTKEFITLLLQWLTLNILTIATVYVTKEVKGAIEEVTTLYYKGIDCLGYDGT